MLWLPATEAQDALQTETLISMLKPQAQTSIPRAPMAQTPPLSWEGQRQKGTLMSIPSNQAKLTALTREINGLHQ